MRVQTLFVLFCFFYILVICSILMLTGNFKSCGLSPECNIHRYVLDVSMPKHTMHCSPDLVTVLPCWFICSLLLLLLLCCWLVGRPPGSAPLCLCLLGVHGLLEDNLYKPNSSEKKKNSQKWRFNAPLRFCHLSMCCYHVSVWLFQQVKFYVFRYT